MGRTMQQASGTEHGVMVVGAGVGGLLAALTAARGGAGVTLVEPHPLGGRARVDERGGYRFNRGPRAIYVGGEAERLLAAAGVDPTRGGAPGLRSPVVVRDGELHPMPGGATGVLRSPLFTWRQKVRAAQVMGPVLRGAAKVPADVSVAEWLDHVRADGALRLMVEALVRVSTYTDAPEELSAQAALANAHLAATNGVRYLDGGFQALVDQLAVRCADAGVELLAAAADAVRATPEGVEVDVEGTTHRAGAAVIAAGGPDAAAALLGEGPEVWGPSTPARAACLEVGGDRVPDHGFALGLDEPLYLSLHCPPADLAPEGRFVVHAMRYLGPTVEPDPERDRARLHSLVEQVGLGGHVEQERFLGAMVVTGGIPLASQGGLAGRPTVEVPGHAGVLVAGDWVGPRGLLLDAVAASATDAGRRAAARSASMVAA